jgi:hypothetical protein
MPIGPRKLTNDFLMCGSTNWATWPAHSITHNEMETLLFFMFCQKHKRLTSVESLVRTFPATIAAFFWIVACDI